MHRLWVCLIAVLVCSAVWMPAAAQEIPTLPEMTPYTSPDGRISLDYPAGWAIHPDDSGAFAQQIILATDETALNKQAETDTFAPGEALITMIVDTANVLAGTMNVAPDDPAEMLQALMTYTQAGKTTIVFSDITKTTISDYPAARALTHAEERSEGMIVIWRGDGVTVVMALFTAPGEEADWEPLALAVAESIRAVKITLPDSTAEATAAPDATAEATIEPTPLALTGTAALGSGLVSLSYPAEWLTLEIGTLGLRIANTDAALRHALGDPFVAGQIQVLVAAGTIADLTPQINLGLPNNAGARKLLVAASLLLENMGEVSAITETTLGGRDAVMVSANVPTFDVQMIVIDLDSRAHTLGIIQITTASGEMADWQPTIQAILETITFPESGS